MLLLGTIYGSVIFRLFLYYERNVTIFSMKLFPFDIILLKKNSVDFGDICRYFSNVELKCIHGVSLYLFLFFPKQSRAQLM